MPNQLIIKGAAVPGAADSYYSAKKTISAIGGTNTVIPEIGWIIPVPAANMSIVLRTDADSSPPTYDTVEVANVGGAQWSDGANLFVHNASSTANFTYYVLAHKP
jgi:hypothetical protein